MRTVRPTADTHPLRRAQAAGERYPLAVVGFGVLVFSTGPVIVAATSVSGPVFSFWRLWFGSLLLTTVAIGQYVLTRRRPTTTGVRWALASGAAFGAHQLLFMSALKATSVVDVTLMNTVAPILVAVLAVPLFGERPGLRFRLWSVVAIVGAAAVAVLGSSGPDGKPLGMALAAGNVVFYSCYFVGSKAARDHIDTVYFLFTTVLVSALLVTAFVVITGAPVGDAQRADLLAAAAVALLPGFIGHFSVTWPLRWVPANLPPLLLLTIPIFSGVLAWALLDQPIEADVAFAGLITLGGVAGAVLSGRSLTAAAALDLAEEA